MLTIERSAIAGAQVESIYESENFTLDIETLPETLTLMTAEEVIAISPYKNSDFNRYTWPMLFGMHSGGVVRRKAVYANGGYFVGFFEAEIHSPYRQGKVPVAMTVTEDLKTITLKWGEDPRIDR